MKRFLSLLCTLLTLPLLFACDPPSDPDVTVGNTDYSLEATVTELGEKILVEVTKNAYDMTGPFLINTDKATAYENASGQAIKREDIAVGDTVVIYYSGQVMMSFPAQVYAARIIKK